MDSNETQAEPEPQPPSLPTEIIHRIIQLALPRVSFKSFRERYETLLDFALVDQRWRELAQRELLRHVLLRRDEQAGSFVRFASTEQHHASTKALWLEERKETWSRLRDDTVSSATKACPKLHSVWLTSWRYEPQPGVDLQQNLMMKDLQDLRLDCCSIRSAIPCTPSTATLPNVRALALSCLPSVNDYSTCLHSIAMPSLQKLALITIERDIPAPRLGALLDMARPLAARITTLALAIIADEPSDLRLPDHPWQHFTALQELGLDHDIPIPADALRLSSLRTLWLRPTTAGHGEGRLVRLGSLYEALQDPSTEWEYITKLVIPSAAQPGSMELKVRKDLARECEERDIELQNRTEYPSADYSALIEDVFNSDCKR